LWSCNFNNLNNFVTLASTRLRLPEYDADAVKHVGVLTINKILLIYRVSQEECAILRESVPYVKLYRYNPKHLYPKLNGYGDNGQRILKI